MLATKVASLNPLAPSSLQFSHKTLTFHTLIDPKVFACKKLISFSYKPKTSQGYQKCSLLKYTFFTSHVFRNALK